MLETPKVYRNLRKPTAYEREQAAEAGRTALRRMYGVLALVGLWLALALTGWRLS